MRDTGSEGISRRHFLALAAGGALVGSGSLLAGARTARRHPLVLEYPIHLAGLPAGFDGFRVLLVSDIHAGAHMDESRMRSVVDLLNALDADLVVLGGDMVDGSATLAEIRSFGRSFAGLGGNSEMVAVTGNHEYFAGIEVATREMRRAGIPLIRGDHTLIRRSGDMIAVLCMDDPHVPTFDPPQPSAVSRLVSRAPTGVFSILVSHRPGAFAAAAQHGIALTLAGHTHGGQVGLPHRDLTPVRLVTKYVRGHYERDGAHLVVSSGVGSGGMPMRLGRPPTVEVVTLLRA